MGETIVFTSGKGGVGKTTSVANIGMELSRLDKKVLLIDTDFGLRNLDVVMGLEEQIRYDLSDVFLRRCRLKQALIKDKRYPNLYVLPASTKTISRQENIVFFQKLIEQVKQEFDYCLLDCPAGIEEGFHFSVSVADRVVVVTTPQISALSDAICVFKELEAYSLHRKDLILNQYEARFVRKHLQLSVKDVEEIVGHKVLGCIENDSKIPLAQNKGVFSHHKSFASLAKKIHNFEVIPCDFSPKEPRKKGVIYDFSEA